MTLFISEQADTDLLHIHTYLVERNPATAAALVLRFNQAFENLTRFPFIGRDRSNLTQGARSIVVETYVVFYRVDGERVTISRVMDGRRDIEAEFQR
jgi:toxin ParE1/3/4